MGYYQGGRLTGWQAVCVLAVYITLYSTSGVLTKLALGDGGYYRFNPVSITLAATALKFTVSVLALLHTDAWPKGHDLLGCETFKFAYPGVVYLIDDNLTFAILYYLTPGEAALFMNIKVLTTAFTLKMMLRKRVTAIQWSALCVLALGLATAKMSSSGRFGGLNPGHAIVLLVCVIGSTGDVYNEKLLKDSLSASLHLQNAKLYAFGIVLNLLAYVAYELFYDSSSLHLKTTPDTKINHMFHGWNWYTSCLLVVNALVGLTTSVIFKFLDNIVKVQAAAGGMVLTVILSALLFGKEPAHGFYLGVGIVANSLFIYHYHRSPATEPPAPVPA